VRKLPVITALVLALFAGAGVSPDVEVAQAHDPPCWYEAEGHYAYLDYHWHQCRRQGATLWRCLYPYCWEDSGGCGYPICPQRGYDKADPTSFRLEGL
jgi:hypothetical protein